MEYGLHHTDCIDFALGLPDDSIDLIICDSPYWNTDLAFDKQPFNLPLFLQEARRVLTPTGVMVCFAAETFTLDLIMLNRAQYRYRMVWAKTRASRGMDKAWRPLCGHEDIIVFAPAPKSATYNPQMAPHFGPKKNCQRKTAKQAHYKTARTAMAYEDNGTRHPTTVLEYPSVGTTAPHFNPTAKPLALVQDLVLTYSNPGDRVWEPFAGDAPAAHACENTGRLYLGCELNAEQYRWSAAHLARKAPLFATRAAHPATAAP